MKLSAEERLDLEQAGISPQTIQKMSEETITPKDLLQVTREMQEVIGPHGSTSRLQAGGVRITREGMSVYEDGVRKTSIDQDGNLFVGSDIDDPTNTTLSVFVNDQTYNSEEMGAGDLLIGDNSEDRANIKYDASEGQLLFRGGTTSQITIDTDGSILAGGGDVSIDAQGIWITNQQAAFGFEDTNGDRFKLYIYSDGDDFLGLINDLPGKGITQFIRTTDNAQISMSWREGGVANSTLLDIDAGTAGALLSFGGGVSIWSGRDSTATVFNEDSFDIDHRFETATNTHGLYIDGGAEYVSFFGDSANGLVIIDNGTEKRLEIGRDHYFPTRDSSNKNGFWNEANEDMDFTFEGDTAAINLISDAGLNAIGIGGAAESGYKLKVTGDTNLDGALIVNNSGANKNFQVKGDTNNLLINTDASADAVGVGVAADAEYMLSVGGDINISSGSKYYVDGDAVLDGNTHGVAIESNANDIFRCNSSGASAFAGTIATLPGGAVLTYNVTSGNENAMVPVSTSQLAKMRLYNTTRGTSALISNVVTGTNTITLTANVPAGWATTDVITIASQTVSGGGVSWVDFEVTSGPTSKSALWVHIQASDTTSTNIGLRLHPLETFSNSKIGKVLVQVTSVFNDNMIPIKMTSNVFSASWEAGGAASMTVTCREAGYNI